MAEQGNDRSGNRSERARLSQLSQDILQRVFDLSLPLHLSLVLVRHKTVDSTIRNYLAKDYSRLKLAVNSL